MRHFFMPTKEYDGSSGALDGAWGAHAVAIAEYAAGGVLELLARASAR